MKKVPELRFADFDGEWKEKILGNCIKLLKSGLSRKLSDYDIGVPVVRANNTFDNKLDMDNDVKYWYEDDPQGANIDNYAIQKNDILVNFINSKSKMGTAAIVEKIPNRKTIYTTNIMRVVLSYNLNPYYFLMITLTISYKKYIEAISMPAVNQSSFTTADYKKLKFNSPCIGEQEKIGDLFKKLDDLIEIQESKISKMEDFKKSMLQKTFPKKDELVPEFRFDGFDEEWKNVYVKELGSFLGGTSIESHFNKKGEYKVISIGSYSNNSKYIDQGLRVDLNDKTKSRLLSRNDLAMVLNDKTTQGNIIGRALLIDEDNKYIFNQRTQRISPDFDKYNSLFLYYLFNSDIFRNKIKKISQGNTQIYVNWPNVESISLKVPTKKEQQKIGQFFKNLDTQIENEEKLLESYKMMKKSLLQKMFV